MSIKNIADGLSALNIECAENISLKAYSTFKIGGSCPLGVFPKSADELWATVSTIHEYCGIYAVIGNGSNILFSDYGFEGVLVFTYKMNGVRMISDTEIYAEAGAKLAIVSSFAQKNGLSGAEFMHGIPGTCGGALYMNAGAYGSEMSNVVKYTDCLNLNTGEIVRLCGDEHGFSYRNSVFQDRKELIVIGTCMELIRGDADAICATMHQNMQKRKASQPLEYPNAGSAFKRPENGFAAKMIDECGLKGYAVGGAQVSEKHAGFIVNVGGATAKDVLELMKVVADKVEKKFGVRLQSEIEFLDRYGDL